MTDEEIKSFIKDTVKENNDTLLELLEGQIEKMFEKSKSEISDLVDTKMENTKLELKGIAGKPKLIPNPDYNADGKLHGLRDIVVMKPTKEWSQHGALNPTVPTHEADKEFTCTGSQADSFGKTGKATFVKVQKVYEKVATLNKTAQPLN